MNHEGKGRGVAAVILIGVGVISLIAQFTEFSLIGVLWPGFILLPGLAFLGFAFSGDSKTGGFVVPGLVITTTGLILFYQNITGHWESWAYIWTLYPASVGLSLVILGRTEENREQAKVGRNMLVFSLVGFVVFAAFFELFIFNNTGGEAGRVFLPLMLIIGGIVLLLSSRLSFSGKLKNDEKIKFDDH